MVINTLSLISTFKKLSGYGSKLSNTQPHLLRATTLPLYRKTLKSYIQIGTALGW